jgi:sugar phosphate permease
VATTPSTETDGLSDDRMVAARSLPRVRVPRYYGWTVLAACSSALFGAVALSNPVLGAFVDPLESSFGWSRTELSIGLTAGMFASAAMAPFVGMLLDRHGGRWVIATAAAVMCVVLLLLASMNALWQFVVLYGVGRMVQGSAVRSATYVVSSNWFVRRRPLANSVVSTAERIGQGTMPLALSFLIAGAGWRAGWVSLSAAVLVCSVIPAAVWIRRRPEDHGLSPDGDAAHMAVKHAIEGDPSLGEAVRTRLYWSIALALVLFTFSGAVVNFHTIPLLQEQGLSLSEAASAVSAFSIAGIAGGLLAGPIGLRLSSKWAFVGALVAQGGAVLLLGQATTVGQAIGAALLYGLPFGAAIPLANTVVADAFGRRALGAIRGSIEPAQLPMMALGPLAVSVWFDASGGYDGPIFLVSVAFVLAAVVLAASGRTKGSG